MRFAGCAAHGPCDEPAGLRRFLAAGNGCPDIAINVHPRMEDQRDLFPGDACLFDSGGPWKLFEAADRLRFTVTAGGDTDPYQVLDVGRDFSAGDLYCLRERSSPVLPIDYPLDELLIVNHIAHHAAGVEVHSLGIDDGGRGLLFVGVSGAGKSSAAQLWAGCPGVTVLSDDRIVLRRQGGRIFAHGTPCTATPAFAIRGASRWTGYSSSARPRRSPPVNSLQPRLRRASSSARSSLSGAVPGSRTVSP